MKSLHVNFLLVKIEKPTLATLGDSDKNLRDFEDTCKTRNALPPKGTRILHENLWLLPPTSGILWLASVHEAAIHFGVSLRVYFLEHEPEWIDLFDAKTY